MNRPAIVRFVMSFVVFMERMITKYDRHGRRPVFDTRSFPWVAELEAGWPSIRAELDGVMVRRDAIPNFQDISPVQRMVTEGDDWKTYFLYGYGHRMASHCERCPETARLVRRIPGMKTAMFSILAPKKHIPPHRGPYKGVLRYHLALLVPDPPGSCRIRVADEVHRFTEGKSLIFDDTFVHEVWNDSDGYRVVLFVDLVRDLPLPLSLLNRLAIWGLSRTPFILRAVERVHRAG